MTPKEIKCAYEVLYATMVGKDKALQKKVEEGIAETQSLQEEGTVQAPYQVMC